MTKVTEIIINNKSVEVLEPLERVESLVEQLGKMEAATQHTKAQVGYLLTEIAEQELWRTGHESFYQFLLSLEEKYNQSYSSLYSYFSTARELKPLVSQEQFDQIGISKAQEIAKAHKSGLETSDMIARALDPESTVKSLQGVLVATNTPSSEQEGTKYVDFSVRGYCTEEESLVMEAARKAAWTVDQTPSEWSEGKRNLRAQTLLSMEFLSEHGS